MEFSLREFNTGSFPRGLSLMLGILSQWIYDRNPLSGVRFEAALAALKDDVAQDRPVFQDLIRKYLLGNTHRVRVVARPDEQLEGSIVAREADALAAVKDALSEAQIDDIIAATQRLKQAQVSPDTVHA